MIAGKCAEEHERRYLDEEVAPLLGDGVAFIGEVHGERKEELLADASCLLVPSQWEEPFGLVCIEALAAGTAVVGLRRGAVSELVDHGRTGWLADDPDELAGLIARVGEIDPHACRSTALERYDVGAMAAGYERAYRSVLSRAVTDRQ